jgi:cytochrome c-type biogenesis protein CcmF
VERKKYFKVIFLIGVFVLILILMPIVLNLYEVHLRVELIAFLGNFLLYVIIGICLIDLFILIILKKNLFVLFYLNMMFSITLFLLMEYSFINEMYDIFYVWRYTDSKLPFFYRMFAIWAGGAGAIMTWMVFNSIFIFLFRIKNYDREDRVFLRSNVISLSILIIFLIVLISFDPFMTFGNLKGHIITHIYNDNIDSVIVTRLLFPNGSGLNTSLENPLLLWHPLFTFLSYSIMLIPFTVTIAEILTPKNKISNFYQLRFFDFTLRFGWLVSTLALGLGAFWANTTLTWEFRYWGWDPVETALLIPWIFNTAYFHTFGFPKNRKNLIVKLNILLTFFAVIFATLITRGGGFSSLHAYIAGKEIVFFVLIIGFFMLVSTLSIILILVNLLTESYNKKRTFFNYLNFLFFYFLAFLCLLGLILPPLTFFLSEYLPINPININSYYYIIAASVPAIGIAVSLIYCSLWNVYKLKWIFFAILTLFLIQLIISMIIFSLTNFWINPIIIIYFFASFSSILSLKQDFNIKNGIKDYFRKNSKNFIHLGITFILIGTLGGPINWQDFFYIVGFFILIFAIITSFGALFINFDKDLKRIKR